MQSYPPQEAPPDHQEDHDWESTGGRTSFTCRRCGVHAYESLVFSGRIIVSGSGSCYQRVVKDVMES